MTDATYTYICKTCGFISPLSNSRGVGYYAGCPDCDTVKLFVSA